MSKKTWKLETETINCFGLFSDKLTYYQLILETNGDISYFHIGEIWLAKSWPNPLAKTWVDDPSNGLRTRKLQCSSPRSGGWLAIGTLLENTVKTFCLAFISQIGIVHVNVSHLTRTKLWLLVTKLLKCRSYSYPGDFGVTKQLHVSLLQPSGLERGPILTFKQPRKTKRVNSLTSGDTKIWIWRVTPEMLKGDRETKMKMAELCIK